MIYFWGAVYITGLLFTIKRCERLGANEWKPEHHLIISLVVWPILLLISLMGKVTFVDPKPKSKSSPDNLFRSPRLGDSVWY